MCNKRVVKFTGIIMHTGPLNPVPDGLDVVAYDATERVACQSENYRVFTVQVDHGKAPANAYKIESAEGVVVVSGDIRPCRSLIDLENWHIKQKSERWF